MRDPLSKISRPQANAPGIAGAAVFITTTPAPGLERESAAIATWSGGTRLFSNSEALSHASVEKVRTYAKGSTALDSHDLNSYELPSAPGSLHRAPGDWDK